MNPICRPPSLSRAWLFLASLVPTLLHRGPDSEQLVSQDKFTSRPGPPSSSVFNICPSFQQLAQPQRVADAYPSSLRSGGEVAEGEPGRCVGKKVGDSGPPAMLPPLPAAHLPFPPLCRLRTDHPPEWEIATCIQNTFPPLAGAPAVRPSLEPAAPPWPSVETKIK